MPKRIQRKRTKGWKMPANAVYVGRPTRWGNPFHWKYLPIADTDQAEARRLAVREFNMMLTLPPQLVMDFSSKFNRRQEILENIEQLRGKDLVCWCKLSDPCHADVLLELANQEPQQ